MSSFFRFFRKHVGKCFRRRSEQINETEHNDSRVESSSFDPPLSSLDNPSPGPSIPGAIQPTLSSSDAATTKDLVLSSLQDQNSSWDNPLVGKSHHSHSPATSIESPLDAENIEAVIRDIEDLVLSSIFKINFEDPVNQDPELKVQNQNLESKKTDEPLLVSPKSHHVNLSEQIIAISEEEEALQIETVIPQPPEIEIVSNHPSVQGESQPLIENILLLSEDSRLNPNKSSTDDFTQRGLSPQKSVPTETYPDYHSTGVAKTKQEAYTTALPDQVSKNDFDLERKIHAEISIHIIPPNIIRESNQFPQSSAQSRPAATVRPQSGKSLPNYVKSPSKPKDVADSKQVAKSSTHSGLTKDMVAGSERAPGSPSPKLSQLPRNSTSLRNYLESTSVRRAASPNPASSNRHVPSEKRSVPNIPRTPPRQNVSTERSTAVARGPVPKAPSRPSTPRRNLEPAPKDDTEEHEECPHKAIEESPDAPATPAEDVSLITLTEVSESTKEVIERAMRKFGMKEITTEGYWNVRWSDNGIPIQIFQKLLKYQRVNRFPGSGLLMTKNNLAKNTSKMKQTFPEEYDFVPETWCLPGEITKVELYAKIHERDSFIVKPNDGSSGRGIIVTRNIAKLKACDKMVCQVYIRRPFLIDGYKFDLRVYTLMTSCRPLRLFVYNEGLARFATEQYQEPNQQNESNRYMHLTNYAVNKRSPLYTVDETKGTLRRLSTINKWLARHNVDSKKVWESMDEAIVKTIISFLPALRHYYRVSFPEQTESNSCFQIMGFDIIFDENLKPYVLEVNDSPSFKADVPLDKEMTNSLIHDTFDILHLNENNRSKVLMEEKRQSRMRLMSSSTQNRTNLHKEKEQSQRLLTQSRIDWENTHMGNFRKVFPNDGKMKHYKKFIRAAQEIFQHHPW